MLNPNAQKWVAALRSGKYKQGKGKLCDSTGNHCCLGIACRVYEEEIGGLKITSLGASMDFDGCYFWLPSKVQKWLGLRTDFGEYDYNCLSYHNDHGNTFDEIADIIESEPEGLFGSEI